MSRSLLFAVLTTLSLAALPQKSQGEAYFSLNLSSPLLLSGSAGLYVGGDTELGGKPLRATFEGEVGIGGGKILAGFDTIGSGFGYGLKGSLLRTWFEPVGADRNNTYLGMELQGSLAPFIVSLGGYRRIEGDGDGWLGTLSLGFRF